MDHFQDDIGDFESFKLIADSSVDLPEEKMSHKFFDIFKACTKKHSNRPSSSDVSYNCVCCLLIIIMKVDDIPITDDIYRT